MCLKLAADRRFITFLSTANYSHIINIFIIIFLIIKLQVAEIFGLCNYLGLDGNYMSDIAILKVDRPFEYSSHLIPICLDTNSEVNTLALLPGKLGKVAGFGKTETGEASKRLLTIEVPIVSPDECNRVAGDSRKFITQDKFCAGYTNGNDKF